MSARSSLHSALLVAAVLAGGCGNKTKPPPEADPAQVQDLAKKLVANMPGMAAVRECKDADFANTTTLTFRSVLQLAGEALSPEPRDADWINPPQLDSPAIRTLLDSKDDTAKRRAAADVLAAKAYLLYKVDVVNAPIALLIKELKIGTVLTRAIVYEKTATPRCVVSVDFQNDRAKSDWAISVSDKTLIDPAVAKAMRDDLAEQFLKNAPGRAPAAPPPSKK